MRTVLIPGTDIVTSNLAFGCAGLYREPDHSVRTRLLDVALHSGVQHFDTAPMYGFGLSERELGEFARGRRDKITIATKFGIEPNRFGAAVGHVQGPIRRLLKLAPDLAGRAQSNAPGPSVGGAGSVIYRRGGFSPLAARKSLESSLRRLRTDYLDIFLLHEPGVGMGLEDELRSYLNETRESGLIRAWGAAGEPQSIETARRQLGESIPVLQMPFDFGNLLTSAAPWSEGPAYSFYRVLGAPVAAILSHLRGDRSRLARWQERVGVDRLDKEVVARLLLTTVALRTPDSLLLFTSNREDHIESAVHTMGSIDDAPEHDGDVSAFAALLSTEARAIFRPLEQQ